MRAVFAIAVLVASAAAAGCSGPVAERDGGPDAAPDAALPTEPDPPAPLSMAPCPEGWREVPFQGGSTRCDPWPPAGRAACGPAEAHFPGEAGCAAVGTACPAGGFPEGLPGEAPVLYVAADAAEGGDGSPEAPYRSVRQAAAGASPGTIVAIGPGRYDESVLLRQGVALWGACASETVLDWSTPHETAGAVTVAGAGTIVRNLTLSGEGPALFAGDPWVEAHLEDVIIDGALDAAVIVGGGAVVTAESLVVRGTRPDRSGRYGRGVHVELGGSVHLARAVVEGSTDAAVVAMGEGTSLALDGVAVLETGVAPAGAMGFGVAALDGAQVVLVAVVVEGSAGAGVEVADAGTRVTVDDLVVRGTRVAVGSLGLALATGLAVESGAEVEGSRVSLEGNGLLGLVAVGEGSRAALSDLAVLDMGEPDDEESLASCVEAMVGAEVEAERVLLSGCRGAAVLANAGRARLVDAVVEDTVEMPDGRFGWGVGAGEGGSLELLRARVERSREAAVIVFQEGSSATLEQVAVLDTLARACATGWCADEPGGSGLVALEDAHLEARGFAVRGCALAGVQLARGGEVDLHDGQVSGCAVGANVQTEGFDLARLMDGVVYLGNDRDLDATSLPVPSADLP